MIRTPLALAIALVLSAASPDTNAAEAPATTAPAATRKAEPSVLTRTAKNEEEAEEQEQNASFQGEASSSLFGGTTLVGKGSPENILRHFATYVLDTRIIFHGVKLPTNEYAVSIYDSKSKAIAKLAAAYAEHFKVRVAHETREADVLILEADEDKIKTLPPAKRGSNSSSTWSGHSISMTFNGGFNRIAEIAEGYLKVPVFNESKNKSNYNLTIEWNRKDPESLPAALAAKGFKLTKARRKIDALHVEPLPPSSQPAK